MGHVSPEGKARFEAMAQKFEAGYDPSGKLYEVFIPGVEYLLDWGSRRRSSQVP